MRTPEMNLEQVDKKNKCAFCGADFKPPTVGYKSIIQHLAKEKDETERRNFNLRSRLTAAEKVISEISEKSNPSYLYQKHMEYRESFGGDTGADADYKYEHDQINEDDGFNLKVKSSTRRGMEKLSETLADVKFDEGKDEENA